MLPTCDRAVPHRALRPEIADAGFTDLALAYLRNVRSTPSRSEWPASSLIAARLVMSRARVERTAPFDLSGAISKFSTVDGATGLSDGAPTPA